MSTERFDIVEAVRRLVAGKPVTRAGSLAWFRLEGEDIISEDAYGEGAKTKFVTFMTYDLLSKEWIEVDTDYKQLTLRMGTLLDNKADTDKCDVCPAPYTAGAAGWGMRANHLLCPKCFARSRP